MGVMKSAYTRKHTGTMPQRGHPDWYALHQLVRTAEIERANLSPVARAPRQTGEHPALAPWEQGDLFDLEG
jgi:hypothetical protein